MIRVIRPILLVEDSLPDAEMTMDALREAHVANRVDHVEDGADALDYLYREGAFADRDDVAPTLILLDVKMPRVDGIECLRAIRADERTKLLPVVMLTSSREERDLTESWNLGVNAYVVKPVDTRQFFDAVRTLGQFWAVLNETATPQ
jgi:two-component system, response regulator